MGNVTHAHPAPLAAAIRSPLDVGASDSLGPLPVWDLSDLYRAPDDPALAADLDRTEAEAKAFAERYVGRLGAMEGDALAAAIAEYERMEERLGRAMSYAQLVFSGDAADPANGRFYQTVQERLAELVPAIFIIRVGPSAIAGRNVGGLKQYGIGSLLPEEIWIQK